MPSHAHTTPAEALLLHQEQLHRHQQQCQACLDGWAGRWFELAARGERVHRQLAPRFLTTVLVTAVVMGLVLAVFA